MLFQKDILQPLFTEDHRIRLMVIQKELLQFLFVQGHRDQLLDILCAIDGLGLLVISHVLRLNGIFVARANVIRTLIRWMQTVDASVSYQGM
jgi:hypothetical protein